MAFLCRKKLFLAIIRIFSVTLLFEIKVHYKKHGK